MDTGLFIMYGFLVLLAVMPKQMIAKNRKGNNMSNGLLAMYIFLAVFATGLVIYSKWEDKHQQQEQ